jgi:hypothetical protein
MNCNGSFLQLTPPNSRRSVRNELKQLIGSIGFYFIPLGINEQHEKEIEKGRRKREFRRAQESHKSFKLITEEQRSFTG